MNFLTKNEDQYVLLDSSIDYLNATAYLSLVFLNGEELTLKSTHLLSIGYNFIDYLKDSKSIKISINPSSEKTFHKLLLLFDEALNYE
ncbi:hypothetical protein [Acinetobacter sp. YH12201]|uniref:hypothetical protein n=1 Tax=Acinetobacter sp. YH12201 TaxID=2601140 RepID=UPI0015D1A7C1|nr:hypothetical protein [Acinetobacter sp. YH12201]